MRIITGIAKGTRLKAPKGLDVRPTADRVKESIFNIIINLELPTAEGAVAGAHVLDLFAGTGNLGLEALSRGAAHALFIDHSQHSLAAIKDNIHTAKLSEKTEIWRGDSVKAIDKLSQLGRTFRLIFIDPPYNQGLVSAVLLKLDTTGVAEAGGLIVVEHSKHEPITTQWQHLKLIRTERYGETVVTFLMR
ncbi:MULTISPECIES: 16S rRNA (guanine(966)-N(2))-methyltransferase RsmD [Sporomusa]|jgi:16S rRNA (guanine966-N2)-methyltransferase|uniref:16S rRNA (guanine(966)-N(2))-methyltransferase RsmD n=1 Tax=Sporomusa TaxID=2375 RepID=UPI00166EDB20|nr:MULTISPECIES: 16S rRNA (guanine(966)-N(2))-methyltransferase RsmD [Sporomusa]MCM0760255.1 16S rRNA (guanine(966)-N(2))-methyltransferase RsmD [Sporomusa sphaeroides DSM 2875]